MLVITTKSNVIKFGMYSIRCTEFGFPLIFLTRTLAHVNNCFTFT